MTHNQIAEIFVFGRLNGRVSTSQLEARNQSSLLYIQQLHEKAAETQKLFCEHEQFVEQLVIIDILPTINGTSPFFSP